MSLQIGWGRREIAMEGNLSIPGQMYIRIAERIMDPLYATALCVDGGEKPEEKVIFLSCDVISIRSKVIDLVEEKARKLDPSIPAGCIVMNATHTHTGGNCNHVPEKTADGVEIIPGEVYKEFLTDRAAEAAAEAWQNRKPGKIAYGYGYAVVGHSRRVVYFDDRSSTGGTMNSNGHCVMYGKTNDPQFSHYETSGDHFLNAMFTFDETEKLTGMVLNVPCPSQLSEHMCVLSADYWGNVREKIAEEFGKEVFVLPQCAAAGDLSPRILHYLPAQRRRMKLKYDGGYELQEQALRSPKGKTSIDADQKALCERRDIAERIVTATKEVYSWAKNELYADPPVRHRMETIRLKRRMITAEEAETCKHNLSILKLEIPEDATPEVVRKITSRYQSAKGRNERVIDRFEHQMESPTTPMRMHVVAIGDIAFTTNRFELYSDYMHRIQARSPFIQTFVMQLAGENESTYLPTARAMANRGYGASMYENQIGDEGGQQIVDESCRILSELYEEIK